MPLPGQSTLTSSQLLTGPETSGERYHMTDPGRGSLDPGRRSKAVVWLKRPGQGWRDMGAPFTLLPDADGWGAKTASFYLAVKDLVPRKLDEIDIALGGKRVWAGRLTSAAQMFDEHGNEYAACNGEGWQYHTDDELLTAIWAHERLNDWRDMRSFPGAGLGRPGTEAAQIQVGDGGISLAWPNGTWMDGSPAMGVVLDLGPNPATWAKRVIVGYRNEVAYMWGGFYAFGIRNAGSQGVWETIDDFEDADYVTMTTANGFGANAAGTRRATFTTPRRYVMVYTHFNGTASELTAHLALRLTTIKCFRETAYEASDASVLRIDTLAKSLRDTGTVALSRSDEKIEQTSLAVPHFTTEGVASTREALERACSFEAIQPRVDNDRRLVIDATPTLVPTMIATDKAVFEPAEGGAQINRVVVSSLGPDGTIHEVGRSAAELDGRQREILSTPAPSNPSAAVDASGWTVSGAALQITRDTGIFDTSPASFKVSRTDLDYIRVGSYVETQIAGTHERGTVYVAELRLRRDQRQVWRLWYGYKSGTRFEDVGVATFIHPGPAASWATARVAFAPHTTRTSGVFLRIEQLASLYDPYALTAVGDFHFDSVTISRSMASALDQAGVMRSARIELQGVAPLDVLSTVADRYLDVHGKDRLAGSLTVPLGGVLTLPDGQEVEPADLMARIGELVHIPSVTDPSSGLPGRNGRVAGCSYNDPEEFATVAVDERTGDLEVLLGQMGATVR